MTVIWYLLILSLPFTDFSINPQAMAHGGQVSTFLVIALLLAYVGRGLYLRRFELPFDRGNRWFALFFAVALVSVLYSARLPLQEYGGEHAWLKSLKQVVQLGLSASIYLLAPYMIRDRADILATLKAYLASYLLVLVYGCLELWCRFVSLGQLSTWLESFHSFGSASDMWDEPRAILVASEPSFAAHYLLAVLPFLILGVFPVRSGLIRRLLAASGLFLFAFTFSLGGYLALIVTLIVAVLYFRTSFIRPILTVAALVGLLLAFSPIRDLIGGVYGRFTGIGEDESAIGRFADLQTGYNTFRSSPLVGVGIGNEVFYFSRDFPEWALRDEIARYMFHASATDVRAATVTNMLMLILAETGIIGALFFGLWHLELFRTARDCLRRSLIGKDRDLSLALFLALVAMVLEYYANSSFFFRYVFLIFGLLPAWRNILVAEASPPLLGAWRNAEPDSVGVLAATSVGN